jgi:hypothetical protein
MIDNTKTPDSTDVTLFDREMKYLHDNAFKVLTVNDLGYDTKDNFLYIKPSVAQLTAANPVSLTKSSSINVTRMNGIVPKQSSAITQNDTLAPLSSNSSSHLSHPMTRVNHLSLPNSKSSTSSSISGSHPTVKSSKHHTNSSSHLSHPMTRVNHLSLPNSKSSTSSGISGKSSKHHGYCSYSDYKSNACT